MLWATLIDMPEEQQKAYWRALLAGWERNAERKLDEDCEYDHSEELRAWLDIGGQR
jgi:hypothetical protein